ncbi:MAG: hypothetical protein OHK0015_44000 [Chloroflexi bacterium OHK40]
MLQPGLLSVSVFRRSYGRRYTDLPVDEVSPTELLIDCSNTYMQPAHYDLRAGDIVRWRSGERFIEAQIVSVTRDNTTLRAELAGAHPLPPDFFPY